MQAKRVITGVILLMLSACSSEAELCPGLTDCGGSCADLGNDPENCGSCGQLCEAGQVCVSGGCVAQGCLDECPSPEVRGCAEGPVHATVVCADFDDDPCLDWGGLDPCEPEEMCVEGSCVAVTCSNECETPGELRCAAPPRNGILVCADFVDADPCLEWGGYTPCDVGQSCLDGACTRSGCDNDCDTDGDRICEGAGYRTCGYSDADPCLEWSDVTICNDREACSNGACVPLADCEHDCDEGERKCKDDGYKVCGEFDEDACRDWSSVEACGDGEDCVSGACLPSQCLDEREDCVCGENQCCEGHCCPVLFICVSFSPDDDFCPFGSGE